MKIRELVNEIVFRVDKNSLNNANNILNNFFNKLKQKSNNAFNISGKSSGFSHIISTLRSIDNHIKIINNTVFKIIHVVNNISFKNIHNNIRVINNDVNVINRNIDNARGGMGRLTSQIMNVGWALQQAGLMGINYLFRPFADLMRQSVTEFADFESINARFDSSFRRLAKTGREFTNSFSKFYKMSETDVEKYTSRFMSQFTGMGKESKQTLETSYEYSKRMMQVLVDFTAAQDIPFEESFRRMIAYLAGSSMVIDQFGFANRVRSFDEWMKNRGYGKKYNDPSTNEYQKTAIRLLKLEDDMKEMGFTGQASREINHLSTNLKDLTGRIKEMKIVIGKDVEPILTPTLGGLGGVANFFKEMNPSFRGLLEFLSSVFMALLPIMFLLGKWKVSSTGLKEFFKGGGTFIKFLKFTSWQIYAILAALMAIYYIFEDILIWTRGGKSITGDILGDFEKSKVVITSILKDFKTGMDYAKETIKDVARLLRALRSNNALDIDKASNALLKSSYAAGRILILAFFKAFAYIDSSIKLITFKIFYGIYEYVVELVDSIIRYVINKIGKLLTNLGKFMIGNFFNPNPIDIYNRNGSQNKNSTSDTTINVSVTTPVTSDTTQQTKDNLHGFIREVSMKVWDVTGKHLRAISPIPESQS